MTVVMLLTRTTPAKKGEAATAKKIGASSGEGMAVGEGSARAAWWGWSTLTEVLLLAPCVGGKRRMREKAPHLCGHFTFIIHLLSALMVGKQPATGSQGAPHTPGTPSPCQPRLLAAACSVFPLLRSLGTEI